MTVDFQELSDLLAAYCDDRLTDELAVRLEELASASPEGMRFFVDYMHLHGMLYWDAAGAAVPLQEDAASLLRSNAAATSDAHSGSPPAASRPTVSRASSRRRPRLAIASTVTAVALVFGLGVWGFWSNRGDDLSGSGDNTSLAQTNLETQPSVDPSGTSPNINGGTSAIATGASAAGLPTVAPPTVVKIGPSPSIVGVPRPGVSSTTPPRDSHPVGPVGPTSNGTEGVGSKSLVSTHGVVARIDELLEQIWTENEVVPAAIADDAEWVRRVHLDLVGRIPESRRVSEFLADKRADRRERLIDELLDDVDFSRHFSSTWTNLLVGRTPARDVNRPALAKYLREQFHRNRPWTETVTELVAAEGFDDERGATNFLLAHLNNEAVPATAVTCRVLLCEQVQCTQCHKHPTGDWSQDRFWELNAFFQQTDVVRHRQTDVKTGARLPDRLELVNLDVGGPTFFENRQEEMKVAYPIFEGAAVDPGAQTNRRGELARILTTGDQPQVARAFVNRMWGTFLVTDSPLPSTIWVRTIAPRIPSCWTNSRPGLCKAATILNNWPVGFVSPRRTN